MRPLFRRSSKRQASILSRNQVEKREEQESERQSPIPKNRLEISDSLRESMLRSYPTHSHLDDGAWGKHKTVVMKREVDEWRKLRFLQSANPCPNSQPPLQFTRYSEGLDTTWAICLTLYQAKVWLFVKIPNFSGELSLKEVFKPNMLRAIINRAFPGASCTFTIFIFFLTFYNDRYPGAFFMVITNRNTWILPDVNFFTTVFQVSPRNSEVSKFCKNFLNSFQ